MTPLMAVRAVHFAATMAAVGAVVFELLVCKPVFGAGTPLALRLRELLARTVWVGLAFALASGLAWLILLSVEINGGSLSAALSSDTLGKVLTQTQFGHVWQARGILVVLLALAQWLDHRTVEPPPPTIIATKTLLAAALVGSLAWVGHSGASEGIGGGIHRFADALHLLAASAWLGSLLPLAWVFMAAARSSDAEDAVAARAATLRFSTLGLASVGTLLLTGAVNTWFLAGTLPALVGTDYGQLLLTKVALFLAMVGVASINRLRLTPRLPQASAPTECQHALHQLARNAAVELALGFLILIIVGILGALAPAIHGQPLWPFTWRFDDGAFTSAPYTPALMALGGLLGIMLIVVGLGHPRWRRALVVCGGLAAVAAVFGLRAFTVPAFPTSYVVSPSGYTAGSIARGQMLYAQRCTGCHGATGRGTSALTDLTAEHIYDHPDGDLLWWISKGIGRSMPGFGEALDDDAEWGLVDFIHANADGARLQAGNEPRYQAPDFVADCPDGSTIALRELRGSIVHLVMAGSQSMERLHALAHGDHVHDLATVVIATDNVAVNGVHLCLTREADVLAAFALYRGKPPAESQGTEFLIDATGALRAMWYPGQSPAWSDNGALSRKIAEIRATTGRPQTLSHTH
jgi:copper resistance protein D